MTSDMPEDIRKAHSHTINHEDEIRASKICGCFCCLNIFSPSKITEWINNGDIFAMCPYCALDGVIGDASGYPINNEFLVSMNQYWFDGVVAPSNVI